MSDNTKQKYLNQRIIEVIIYKDSSSCVIAQQTDSIIDVSYFFFENGRWALGGEDPQSSLSGSRNLFIKYAEQNLNDFHRRVLLLVAPKDTLPFIDYLKKNGQKPQKFLLDALSQHELVIYGEIHRREWSWNLLKEVIKDTEFQKLTGAIFFEISSHKQAELDYFYAKDTLDKEIILNVLREVATEGWHDRGMYEFLLDLWKLNHALPMERRIIVIAADIPRPYSTFKTTDEQNKFFDTVEDRDHCMARIIENYMNSKKDNRNCLFIVGSGHVFKTGETAGSFLSKKFKDGKVFTIFTHCPIIDNSGTISGRIRHGIFDHAFYKTGNIPVAFLLKDSPFGKELFDGLSNDGSGLYQDNYDGYIFLGSLETEPSDYNLYDIYSDDFVKELSRRASLDNTTVQKYWGINEATKEAIISKLKEDEIKSRWGAKLTPMIDVTKPMQKVE